MALTLAQLEQYDLQAGWPAQLVPTAAAIEEAESSGDPSAVGPSWNGDAGSWGLFQIQTGAHPDLVAQYGEALKSDPLAESKAGLAVYQGSGSFNPWSTYTGGQYQKYLPDAQAAVGQAGTAPNSSAQTGTCTSSGWQDAHCGGLDVACYLGNLWGSFSCNVGNGLKQAATGAQLAVGLVLIGVGVVFLFKDT
ncbi:MAG: hypothetical protein ACRDK7_11070, partial [Solirubrobacteraceae bacterium]